MVLDVASVVLLLTVLDLKGGFLGVLGRKVRWSVLVSLIGEGRLRLDICFVKFHSN
jgi:hypothetical protein